MPPNVRNKIFFALFSLILGHAIFCQQAAWVASFCLYYSFTQTCVSELLMSYYFHEVDFLNIFFSGPSN